ncbi:MAG TPA: Hsp20/alpha crystallin family protein, partial [Ktedonobacteraceae bacterium]|nr:Hsp20/alpha crystallin family protein [Ktedonobacteraceae bacterium]
EIRMAIRRLSDPFQEALTLHDAMNQLFAQSFVRPGWATSSSQAWAVPIDVFETEQGYQVCALLPGMNPEDIDLTVQQNTLSMKGEFHPSVKEGQQMTWLIQEIGSGTFERTLTFPKPIDADKLETNYVNGVLSILIPLTESSRPKRISVSGSQQQQRMVEAGAH